MLLDLLIKGVNLLGGAIFTDLVVKSMGKRGEREKVAEANTQLAKNTMNTRHRSDRILARKDRSTCSLKSTSEREEHLGEGLDNLETRHELQGLVQRWMRDAKSNRGWLR